MIRYLSGCNHRGLVIRFIHATGNSCERWWFIHGTCWGLLPCFTDKSWQPLKQLVWEPKEGRRWWDSCFNHHGDHQCDCHDCGLLQTCGDDDDGDGEYHHHESEFLGECGKNNISIIIRVVLMVVIIDMTNGGKWDGEVISLCQLNSSVGSHWSWRNSLPGFCKRQAAQMTSFLWHCNHWFWGVDDFEPRKAVFFKNLLETFA